MAMRLGGAAQVEPHSTLVRVGRMGSKGHHLRIYALSWYLGYIEIIFFIHLYSPCGSFSLLIICNDAILRQDPHPIWVHVSSERKSHWILLFNYSFTIGF